MVQVQVNPLPYWGRGGGAAPHLVRVAGGHQVSVGRGELTATPDPPPQGEAVTRCVLETVITTKTTHPVRAEDNP